MGRFAYSDLRLYRERDGTLEVLTALPAGGETANTLKGCGAATPQLGAARFRLLVLSPDSTWAAWGTEGPGACAGVIGEGERAVQVLAGWSSALPDSVLWAPAGQYLAIWLRQAGGRRALSVFDVVEGVRLEMPWELECGDEENCDVFDVNWLGGTLLDVQIRSGPAGLSVAYEVNVGEVPRSALPERES